MASPVESTVVKPEPVHILIVDDDVANGALVTRLLEAAGYAAEQVLSPLKALPLLRDDEYSLVLLDQEMPGMDGLALLEEIRKESTVPVVMLTGADKSALAVRAIRLGAFDYLTKPVDEKRLLETVRQALESDARPGERIAQYEVERELGRGGMGVVYAARDPRLERAVALKVLLPELAADPSYEVQFLAEARSAAKFSHPNIVTVYEAGRFRGRLFMAMEFVKGELLEHYVEAGRMLQPSRVFDIGTQVASALEVMHAAHMVHRDLKPSNLMMTGGSTVKVLDFGLVRPNDPIDPHAKHRGDVSGTLSYTPPEVLSLGHTDARGDIYALGLVLYELLTGVRAFESESMTDLMHRISEARFSRPLASLGGLPPEAIDLLQGMLETKPENRFATIGEVRGRLAALRRISGDRRTGRS